MNSRKFFATITYIITPFLFIIGFSMILYFNSSYNITDNINDNPPPDGSPNKSTPIGQNPVSELLDPYKSDMKPVNFLVLGGDKAAGNTDTMLLVNFNQQKSALTLMSIPRDTKVAVAGSSIPKINSAYPVGGSKLAVDTVSKLFNIKINFFLYLDISVFKQIIDLLDGIEYFVPANMDYDDSVQNLHIHLKKGHQHLNGAQAEQFLRFRQPNYFDNEIIKYYDGSDLKRIQAQQSFIKELISQKANIKYATKANDIINAVFSKLDTNISIPDALKFVPSAMRITVANVQMITLPGEPVSTGASYFIHNVAETDKIMNSYFR